MRGQSGGHVIAATSGNGSTSEPIAESDSSSLLPWLVVAHGILAIIFGALLVFIPGRTLAFVAALFGAYLIVLGLVHIAAALLTHDVAGGQRRAGLLIGLLAIVVGAVVIARPDGSIKVVAVVAGIYLIVMGVTTAILGLAESRGSAALRGGLSLAAGIALLVWPDVTVGVVATIAGIFMLVRGVVELAAGLSLRRLRAPQPSP